MLLSDLLQVIMVLFSGNDQQYLGPAFVSESHRFQLDPMGCRRCQGFHVVHQPVVRHMPFPHLVINHVFRFWDRWIIADAGGQIVAKVLRNSDEGEKKSKGEEEFSHTNHLGWKDNCFRGSV